MENKVKFKVGQKIKIKKGVLDHCIVRYWKGSLGAVHTITSIKDGWVRVDGYDSGYSPACFEAISESTYIDEKTGERHCY